MFLLKELFEKQGLTCPEWLDVILDQEWEDCEYSIKDDVHTWTVDNPFQHLKITWDGKEYRFEGFDDQGELIFTEVRNKETMMIT